MNRIFVATRRSCQKQKKTNTTT